MTQKIVIAGAGSIGLFVGGLLAANGQRVAMLARPRVIAEVQAHGLHLTDFQGLDVTVPAALLRMTDDPAVLRDASLVLVTVKTAATAEMAAEIATHAPDALVLSLQNGLEAITALRAALPDHDTRAGMVPFNVVPKAPGAYHRATSGEIVVEAGLPDLVPTLKAPGLPVTSHRDVTAVQWGKLLMNLNNALNALSGMTLRDQLLDRNWRRLLADQIAEALAAMKAAGITPAPPTPLPVWLTPHLLRLPTPLFTRVAKAAITIDPEARTSMCYDLMAARPTEIDALQGAIIAMGAAHNVPTPVNARVAKAVKSVEAVQRASGDAAFAPLSPEQVRTLAL